MERYVCEVEKEAYSGDMAGSNLMGNDGLMDGRDGDGSRREGGREGREVEVQLEIGRGRGGWVEIGRNWRAAPEPVGECRATGTGSGDSTEGQRVREGTPQDTHRRVSNVDSWASTM